MTTGEVRSTTGTGYQRLIRSGGLVFGARVGGAVVTYATQVVLARWIGPAALGSYVEAFSWCLILSTVAMLGTGTAAMRFLGRYLVAQQFDHLRGYVAFARSATLVISAVIMLAAVGVVMLLLPGSNASEPDDQGRIVALLALLCIPGMAWLRLHTGLSHALSWFALAFVPNILARPLLLILGIMAAFWAGWLDSAVDAMTIHLAVILAVVLGQGGIWRSRFRHAVPAGAPAQERHLWLLTSAPLLLVTLFTQYFPEINVVVLGAFLPSAEVAVFSAGFRTAMLIGFGLTAIDAINLPTVSRLHATGDLAELQSVMRRATRLKFACSLLAVGVLAVFGRHVLALFGPDFDVGYAPMLILAGSQVARAAIGPVAEILSITGHQSRCLLVFAVTLAAVVGVHALLVPTWGLTGGALAVLGTILFSHLWLHRIVVSQVGIDPSLRQRARAQAPSAPAR